MLGVIMHRQTGEYVPKCPDVILILFVAIDHAWSRVKVRHPSGRLIDFIRARTKRGNKAGDQFGVFVVRDITGSYLQFPYYLGSPTQHRFLPLSYVVSASVKLAHEYLTL